MVRVLVVDDSSFMRKLIKDILKKDEEFIIVGEADNGIVAIEKYKELQPDIMTLDIVMEGMDGVTALKEIIKINKNAKIIMVTSIGQEKVVQECLDSGAMGFVIKPFEEDDVMRTVKRIAK